MTRYKMKMTYDGHLFHGFQIQPNQRTVQGEIEKALLKMTKGQRVVVHGSGRTDAGVHAKGQVIHFDYPGKIPAKNMMMALNSLMPRDILFTESEIVDKDFHVQYSTKGKWYRYIVDQHHFTDPFKRFYTGHYPYPVEIEKMKIAAQDLLGEHDFTSFAASGGQIIDKVRTVYYVNIESKPEDKEIVFDFIGNGFLYNMVRIIAGTLIEVGNKRKEPYSVKEALEARDRQHAGPTAPPQGLTLVRIRQKQ